MCISEFLTKTECTVKFSVLTCTSSVDNETMI